MKFLVLSLCGLAAASPANVKLGEEIGALLSRGLSQDPSGFSRAYNAATANIPMTTNHAVEAVARGHSAFLANYEACPVGWTADGDLCMAPSGYYSCARRFNKKLMNDRLKAKFAENCNVEFPSSFLARPILNLHVKESGGDVSSNSAVAASQRAALAALESEEVASKELLGDMLGRLNSQVEASARRISGRQTSFLSQVSDVQREAQNLSHLRSDLSSIQQRLKGGGYSAYHALVHLLNLCSEPNAQNVMLLKFTGRALANLMKAPSTPDFLRNLAGSVLTHISSAPVSSQVADVEGGAGHINIVVPRPSRVYGTDAAVLALNNGASAVDVA